MPTLQVRGSPLRKIKLRKDLGKQVFHTHTHPAKRAARRQTGSTSFLEKACCGSHIQNVTGMMNRPMCNTSDKHALIGPNSPMTKLFMGKQTACVFETTEKNRTLLVVLSHGEVAFVFPQTLRQPFSGDWEPVLPTVKAVKSGPVVSPRLRW